MLMREAPCVRSKLSVPNSLCRIRHYLGTHCPPQRAFSLSNIAFRVLFLGGCLTVAVHSDAIAGFPFTWSQTFGDASYNQYCYSVATDGSGNVIVAGTIAGTVNLGGGDLFADTFGDIFVAKFSPQGVHQWSQIFNGNNTQFAWSVATDASGNVFVVGNFVNTINFGGGNLTSASSFAYDIFVVKFNSAGVHQWSQRFGDTSTQEAYSVATDGSGNVIIAGTFFGTVDFGGGNLTSAGSKDVFVAKFNSAGVHQWSQRYGGVNNQITWSAETDGSGNIFVAGFFLGTIDFGGGILTCAGVDDVFLAKLNPAGVHQWSQRFGDESSAVTYSAATDGGGNVIVAGDFGGRVNFGGSDLYSVGSTDIFVAKWNPAGVHQWSARFGDEVVQSAASVATDGEGNVLLTGYLTGTVDFGGGELTSGGADDIFVAKFNAIGSHRWSQRFGDTGNQVGRAVATDADNNVIVGGYFDGAVNFGGLTHTSAGLFDILVAKFNGLSADPVITSIMDVGNDQGRKVKIRLDGSLMDHARGSWAPIVRYDAFRRDDPAPADAGTIPDPSAPSDPGRRAEGWTYVGSTPAYGDQSYGIDVPTVGDSTIALGQYYSVFFIRAATEVPYAFYDSAPDSGYSLDNLAPGVPTSFAYNSGQLTWDESRATDFDYFTIYGSNTNSFPSATLIDYTVAPTMDVNTAQYVFYFVTTTDFSGNEGSPAVINTLSGVGGTTRNYVLSISSYPNPFNPETTVRYTVPAKGRVTVEVFDARGAHVTTLVDRDRNAGAYTVTWNGHDDRGNASGTGVYFARITSADGARSYKMTLLK